MAATASSDTRLIALDWGTSSLRAFRLGAGGEVLELRHRPWGIMNLPSPAADCPEITGDGCFDHALSDACADWLACDPAPAVLACGMVGSAQGWREAQCLDIPSSLHDLAHQLTVVEREVGPPVHIAPGLIQRGNLPNVMRGEETQVLGVLAATPGIEGDQPVLIGLPGTHSKWVVVRQRQILHFHTFMTGEVFAALRQHTILGRTMRKAETFDHAAFARGLSVANSPDADQGLLSHIFSTRSLGLVGDLPAAAQEDYLSGLLIGHEIASLASLQSPDCIAYRVLLCGETELCRRYMLALEAYGFPTPEIAEHATAVGLWQIAVAAAPSADLEPELFQ